MRTSMPGPRMHRRRPQPRARFQKATPQNIIMDRLVVIVIMLCVAAVIIGSR